MRVAVFLVVVVPMLALHIRHTDGGISNDANNNTSPVCPSFNSTRNDTQIEFYSNTRIPGEPWPVLAVEVPANSAEFACGMVGKKFDPTCLFCGYLLPWDVPMARELFLGNVTSNSEIIFLNELKQVLAISNGTALTQTPILSPEATKYTLLASEGTVSALGLALGDPAKFLNFPRNATGMR